MILFSRPDIVRALQTLSERQEVLPPEQMLDPGNVPDKVYEDLAQEFNIAQSDIPVMKRAMWELLQLYNFNGGDVEESLDMLKRLKDGG